MNGDDATLPLSGVVIAKDDRSEPFVAMRLADWLAMVGK